METRKEVSCGAVIYKTDNRRLDILLMEQNNAHYHRTGSEFNKRIIDIGAKGHKNPGETEEETAIREIKEEIGVDLKLEPGFKTWVDYEFDDTDDTNGHTTHILKKVWYFCAEIPSDKLRGIQLSKEHKSYWFEDINSALKINELEQSKKNVLKKLKDYIVK